MYTLNHYTGTVTRDSDGTVVAPAQNVEDPDYCEYVAWASAGGILTEDHHKSPVPRLIPMADFRARFSDPEMAAILVLAYSGAGDVNAALLLLKLQTTPDIDLDNPTVARGLAYLASKGCIAAERVGELLSSSHV